MRGQALSRTTLTYQKTRTSRTLNFSPSSPYTTNLDFSHRSAIIWRWGGKYGKEEQIAFVAGDW